MRDPAIHISRTAESSVEQFGDQALAYCTWKIVDTTQCGDLARVKTWLAIRDKVKSFLGGKAPDGALDGSRGRSEHRQPAIRRSRPVPETQKRRSPEGHRRLRQMMLCQVPLRTWLHVMKPISMEGLTAPNP
jgi:hypothetical protein